MTAMWRAEEKSYPSLGIFSCAVPSGVIAEHMAVRTHAGLFDVSHWGKL